MESAKKPRRSWLAALVAGPAILLTPFAVFIQHNGYGFLRPEVLICAAPIIAAGLAFGFLLHWGGALARALVLSLLIAFVIDVQVDWQGWWNALILLGVVAIAAATWFLGEFAIRAAAFLFAVILATTLVLPGGGPVERGTLAMPVDDPNAPPPVIHIVLDEQIGPEGIPVEFDAKGEAARMLRDFYVSRGFEVFGRAYSRYAKTSPSMANLLDFSAKPPGPCCRTSVSQNRYFEEMRERGYAIHVYQSDYLDYCGPGEKLAVDYCLTYRTERLSAFADTRLSVPAKAALILGMFTRLSFPLEKLRGAYGAMRTRFASLPVWEYAVGRTTSVTSLQMIPRLQRDLVKSGPGQLFLAHLMIPHSPYAFDRACALRPDPAHWLLNYTGAGPYWKNTVASRALRYPLYLEQMECLYAKLGDLFSALENAGVLDSAVVIVHGDHGSRIALSYVGGSKAQHPSSFADNYSTLFAIKRPGRPGRYDRRLLPIDRLFDKIVHEPTIPEGTAWAGVPTVYLGKSPSPFPGFARDMHPQLE